MGHPAGRVGKRPPPPPAAQARRAKQRRTHRRLIVAGALCSRRRRRPRLGARGQRGRGQPAGRRAEGDPARGEQRIYDKNGEELGIIAGVTNRTVVPGGAIPKVLKDATVAVEDKRFYDHDGVDYYRLVGAVVHDLESGSATQGGSTITMQLVKNLYSPRADRTVSKKLEETYLAFQYEKRYTKNQILARYLNGVFYGQNAIGVQAASLAYFDKDVREITLPQAALLAGPAGADGLQPVREPRGRARAAQRGARGDGRPGVHHARGGRAGQEGGPRPRAWPGL